ncbi:QueT transporter family protein [Bhargavaea ullalensis]|uniref:Membrane protein n=1 Tax=Bhargavaea ullalensis TaxID=1265685 RepID=A0ABV2GB74_9BACL
MKIKTMAINAVIAALYLAVSLLILPFGYGSIQFRISEMFNHLVVFNKKYLWGIVLGVFITNMFAPDKLDLLFGTFHSLISLSITIWICRFIKGKTQGMLANTIVFTFTMIIIAVELVIIMKAPLSVLWITWGTLALSEFAVMLIGIPLISALNKRIDFKRLIEN